MNWDDTAYLISKNRYNENSIIAEVFTEHHGKISGIIQERSIDVMITRLRQKLELDPKNPKYLQTIRGSGYVLWIE